MSDSATTSIRIEAIGQIAVPVSDVERAKTFYRDVLGLRFLFQAPPGLAFFDCGGVRLMLDMPARQAGAGCSLIYYRVADLEGSYETLRARGVTFEREPHLIVKMPDHELWMAFLRDTEDNTLALMSEKRS